MPQFKQISKMPLTAETSPEQMITNDATPALSISIYLPTERVLKIINADDAVVANVVASRSPDSEGCRDRRRVHPAVVGASSISGRDQRTARHPRCCRNSPRSAPAGMDKAVMGWWCKASHMPLKEVKTIAQGAARI